MKLHFEFLLLFSVGLLFAYLGNLISPVGLDLSKDYFPPPSSSFADATAASSETNEASAPHKVKHEFGSVTLKELQEMLASQKFMTGGYLLLDARDDAHYNEGHIARAIQFYHVRSERTLEQVMTGSQKAERIVIYCNGGTCEDSHYAARFLVEFGVNPGAIFIYDGGIKEWKEAGLSLESR